MSSALKVGIIHYHLRGGGVTRVIENTVAALSGSSVQTVVLIGENPPEDCKIKHQCRIVEGMRYGYTEDEVRDATDIAEELKTQARNALGSTPDVWHVHNHALGKNAEVTRAVIQLAEQGHRFLFQLHDFAEDGRPQNYKKYRQYSLDNGQTLDQFLYPQADHLHYGVLNGRDYRFLAEAGLDTNRLHRIQNPVFIEEKSENASPSETKEPEKQYDGLFDPKKKLFLYPTRAIRRKNVGEFVLWAILSDADQEFAITLAPKNPKQRGSYSSWTSLTHKYQLPLHFEVGRRWNGSFPQLMRRADSIVSTSVAEGFGFCFLEPWLFERPLFGRDLPLITQDFRDQDIRFPGLYRSLTLPVDWFSHKTLFSKLRSGLKQTYAAYGMEISAQELDEAIAVLTKNDRIDFGVLDEDAQEKVLELLIHRPDLHSLLKPNHLLPDEQLVTEDIIEQNRQIIHDQFNLKQFGNRLKEIYQTVADAAHTDISYPLSKPLLNRFLDPEMFTLLRS